jgi:hypothetical protein
MTLTGSERESMLNYSKYSLWVLIGSLVISFISKSVLSSSVSGAIFLNNIPALIGILIAVYFDQKAEGLKRKGSSGIVDHGSSIPASIMVTLIIFALCTLVGVVIATKLSNNLYAMMAQFLLPVVPTIGFVGIFMRKKWARTYASILIAIIGLLYLAIGIKNVISEQDQFALTVSFSLFCAFMLWFYNLAFGEKSNLYFRKVESEA